jgi:micrococcal nuclease
MAVALAMALLACQPPGASPPPTRISIQPNVDVPVVIAPSPRPTATPTSATTPGFAPSGPVEEAFVTSVHDGDTIRVQLDGSRQSVAVRYIGMDSPELDGPFTDLEWLGPEAADVNGELVDGQTVFLERDVSDTDRNGRLLRYVWLRDADGWLFVNRELVRAGLAEARDYRPDTKYSDILFDAMDAARAAHVGMWSQRPRDTNRP